MKKLSLLLSMIACLLSLGIADELFFVQRTQFIALQEKQHSLHKSQQLQFTQLQTQLKKLYPATDTGAIITVAAAHYLILLAQSELKEEHNAVAATHLLQAAKNYLEQNAIPLDEATVAALEMDIARLATLHPVDIDALYRMLTEQIASIDVLKIDLVPETTTRVAAAPQTWKDYLSTAWQQMKSLVRIQRDDLSPPLLSPLFLQQTLYTLLLQTEYALIHHDDVIYHASLAQALSLLNRYAAHDETTLHLTASLTKLNQQKIMLILPDINASVSAINTLTASTV